MAFSSYKARVIFKKHTSDTAIAGTYNLLVDAKSMPSPVQAPNTIETTTYENDTQTNIFGIKQAGTKEFTGNLEKGYLDAIDALGTDKLDIFQLYGNDGIGGEAKYYYVGQAVATPSDLSGIDQVVEMSVSVVASTSPKKVTDGYTITDNGDGTFTVAVKSS